ncbi:MAG: cytoplasmic protein [Deltaproteobacteria bacterium]
MMISDLIQRNPIRLFGDPASPVLDPGDLGAIIARAGVGKTSFLVQLALDSLLRGRNLLHVSLDQPVRKVCLWYEEVFRKITDEYGVTYTNDLWETILPHRLIMTFRPDTFEVSHFEERLNDLMEQGIFFPQIVLVDGLPFDVRARDVISEFRITAREHGFPAWFTARAHQEDAVGSDGIPTSIGQVADLFKIIVQLEFVEQEIHVGLLKGKFPENTPPLVLDPSSFLIKQA